VLDGASVLDGAAVLDGAFELLGGACVGLGIGAPACAQRAPATSRALALSSSEQAASIQAPDPLMNSLFEQEHLKSRSSQPVF
jgi:hypothetical protein